MSTALRCAGLGHRYGRRVWGLRDCTLDLPAGRVAALVGPNGSGKTTLMSMAAGLLPASTGSVEAAGGAPAQRLGRIGFVAQDAPLWPRLRVADVLEIGRCMNRGFDTVMASERSWQVISQRSTAGRTTALVRCGNAARVAGPGLQDAAPTFDELVLGYLDGEAAALPEETRYDLPHLAAAPRPGPVDRDHRHGPVRPHRQLQHQLTAGDTTSSRWSWFVSVNLALTGEAALAFALGVAFGALLRRTLPAIGAAVTASIVLLLGARWMVQALTPASKTTGPRFTAPPGSWILGSGTGAPVSYHPAGQHWPLQLVMLAVLLAVAAAALASGWRATRNRAG